MRFFPRRAIPALEGVKFMWRRRTLPGCGMLCGVRARSTVCRISVSVPAIRCAWRWVSAFTGTTSTIRLRRSSRPRLDYEAGRRQRLHRPAAVRSPEKGGDGTASGRFRTDRTGDSPARLRACGSGRADDRGGDFRNDVADAEKRDRHGYVQSAFAAPGTDIDVVIRNKPVRARVVKMPFLKRREAE